MAWYEKVKDFADAIVSLDSSVGFKKTVKYVFLILLVVGLVNIRSILKLAIESVSIISDEIHNEKMEKRDQLLEELIPELRELLGATGADRVLYLEYHNSKENLVGIPFKYVDLVLQVTSYGIPYVPTREFTDINVGNITPLYEDIKKKGVVFCVKNDSIEQSFVRKYPGNHEFFTQNAKSSQQVFVNIPGIHQPVGMIVLEWYCEEDLDTKKIFMESKNRTTIINGLIMKYI